MKMKALFMAMVAAVALIGCNILSPQQSGTTDRVEKTMGPLAEPFEQLEQMDGVFSADWLRSVSLPKVDGLLFVRHIPESIHVAIDSNGAVSVARMELSVPQLGKIISKVLADAASDQPPLSVLIGADDNTPFDKVWPVLQTCCSNGVWKVGFCISAGRQDYMNVLKVYLPMIQGTNAAFRSPLVLKLDTEGTIIGVQTNGLMLARQKGYKVTDRRWVGTEPYPGCIHEAGIPPFGDIDRDSAVSIVPGQGVTYGQVARVVYWCRRFGQATICILREDALPILSAGKE